MTVTLSFLVTLMGLDFNDIETLKLQLNGCIPYQKTKKKNHYTNEKQNFKNSSLEIV